MDVSRLVAGSITGQLRGEITYDWQPTGLVVTLLCEKPGWSSDGLLGSQASRMPNLQSLTIKRFGLRMAEWAGVAGERHSG